MKKRCYAKYSYIIFFILAIVMMAFSAGPWVIETGEAVAIRAGFSITMLLFGMIFLFGAIQSMQFFCVEDNYLIVKSAFGVITKLRIKDSIAYIETLPTYSSWAVSIDKQWICIYDKSIANNIRYRFKSGCSNKRKAKRIQIICTEENKDYIEQFIKIDKRIMFW